VKTGVRDKRSAVNVEALRDKLQAMHSLIEVQDRGPWVGQVARATSLLQGLVLLVAALLLACVTGMIVLVARTNLKLHFKAVSLLHLFGATDDYILRQFQWNNAAIAARGAGIGVVFALLVFGGWVVLSHRWDSPVLPPASFSASHLLAFVLLPLLTGLIAFVATRMTVQSMLRHMH
jgi:cell division protein FtsX